MLSTRGAGDLQREWVLARAQRPVALVRVERQLELAAEMTGLRTARRPSRRHRTGAGAVRVGADPLHREGQPILPVTSENRAVLRPAVPQWKSQLPTSGPGGHTGRAGTG